MERAILSEPGTHSGFFSDARFGGILIREFFLKTLPLCFLFFDELDELRRVSNTVQKMIARK
jgi:hypothetical protein